MSATSRRQPPPENPDTIANQTWLASRYTIARWLKWCKASFSGIPGGFPSTTPTTITPDAVGSAGLESSGWAAADHEHAIATATAASLGTANAEGTATSFSRSDHAHKRAVETTNSGLVRRRLNFSSDFTVADDAGNDEIDVSFAAAAAPANAEYVVGALHAGLSAERLVTNTATTEWDLATGGQAKVNVVGVPASVPVWTKYTVTHTALQAAAMANDIALSSLVAGGIIEGVKIKHSVIFAGTGITDYKISVGIVGNLTKYASAFDVDTAVAATNFQLSTTVGSEDHGSATSIRIAATSTGANLDQSTGGSVDIWVKTSVAV